jgi:hypothetical protein
MIYNCISKVQVLYYYYSYRSETPFAYLTNTLLGRCTHREGAALGLGFLFVVGTGFRAKRVTRSVGG